ncbi:MAG: DNA recombination protein RmuC [Bacteroidales bacterium]|nr:DNA recombination protein RmuC [Bacteroidales bacterium]MCF8457564.1 DNA recombination protein RmuC [Bacteroidales bacterium]
MQNNFAFLLFFLIGFAIGALILGLLLYQQIKKLRNHQHDLEHERELLKSELADLSTGKKVAEEKSLYLEKNLSEQKEGIAKQIQQWENESAKKENRIVELSRELSTKVADLKNLDQKLTEQKSEIENIREKFQLEFKNLANEIFEEKGKKFTEQNRTNIDDILKPLKEKIKDFERKVEETYDKESKQRFSLKEEVKRLAELNQQISLDASNLTKALKGQAKTQGNWGELILENILEKSGLVKDREYFVQQSFQTKDGRSVQPDIVVSYPGARHVVIDSKVSLVAYERFSSAETEEEQEIARKEHLISVKTHIQELSRKNYQDLYQIASLDFVMLFMPIEPAYLIAIQSEPELWNYAYDRRILLISPTNLIAALKMVSSLWQQEYQNRNVQEIARQSGDLYDKFVGLYSDLEDIGKKIDATQTAYNGAMNKLSEGKGNLIKRVESIRSLGAKTKKVLPEPIIQKALEGDTE